MLGACICGRDSHDYIACGLQLLAVRLHYVANAPSCRDACCTKKDHSRGLIPSLPPSRNSHCPTYGTLAAVAAASPPFRSSRFISVAFARAAATALAPGTSSIFDRLHAAPSFNGQGESDLRQRKNKQPLTSEFHMTNDDLPRQAQDRHQERPKGWCCFIRTTE